MQKVRKFLAAVLVAVMMLSLGSGMVNTEAQAAGETGTIQIKDAQVDKTYKAYRIFDLNQNAGGNKFSYRIADKWKAFFEQSAPGAAYVTTDESGALIPKISEDNKVDFSKIAQKYAVDNSIAVDGSVKAVGTPAEIANLPYGYYLVFEETVATETPVSTLITVNQATVEMTPKGTVPTIEKTANKDTADVGEIVNFTIKGKVPNTTGYTKYIYRVKDTMTGLELTGNFTVKIGNTNITQSIKDDQTSGNILPGSGNKNNISINIDMLQYQNNIGEYVTIEYEAKVLKTDNGIGQNSASLDYSNDPSKQDSVGTTTVPPVIVKNYDVNILKHETGDKNIKLQGAEFVLYKENGTGTPQKPVYYKKGDANAVTWVALDEGETVEQAIKAGKIDKVTTNQDGVALIEGLAAGTYKLKEVKAPDGYNIMAKDKEFTIDPEKQKDTNKVQIDVPNSTGTELPGTGGIGNTIFYIVGGALILAGVVLLMRKRAK